VDIHAADANRVLRTHAARVDEVQSIVFHICVCVVGLEVANRAAERIGGEEATEAGGVIASEGVVKAGFGVTLVTGEFVIWRAGCGLQARHLGCGENFLAVGSVVLVVAKLTGSLAWAVAGGDGTRGAEMVGEEIEDGSSAGARSDAAAREEDIFVVSGIGDAASAVCFGEGIAEDRAPIEFGDCAACAIGCGTGFLGDTDAGAVVDTSSNKSSRTPTSNCNISVGLCRPCRLDTGCELGY